MAKIIGNTTATPNPQPNWTQTDETKADFIKNKPTILTEENVVNLIGEHGNDAQIQADWNQINPDAIDYIKNKPTLFATRSNIHNECSIGVDGDDFDSIVASKTPEGGYISGDTLTIKTLISEDKYSYTAYVYDGSIWKAMDGNYNANNVYFDENITITTAVGNISLSNGSGEIPAAGKNLKQVFESLWTHELEPAVTMPVVTIHTPLQYKEVGTTITPTYEASLSSGSYTYGPETGIVAQTWSVVFDNKTRTTAKGEFLDIVVTEGVCFDIKATATYDAGSIPVTNLNNECAKKQIKAGSASASKDLIVGYRPNFYGFKTTAINVDNINSSIVRALDTNQKERTAPVDKATCDTSWMQFFYAVPKGRKTSLKAKDSNNMPLTVNSKDITVNHIGGASSLYTVFYINNAAVYGATTLTLTWG